jgi:hypothetical protein
VAVTVAAIWAVGGVGASQALRAVAYEVTFVVLPGTTAFAAIDGRRRPILTTVALGWAFGYALEVGAFCAAAAAGERWIFRVYPVVVTLAAAGWIWHRRAKPAGSIGIRRGATPFALRARGMTHLALGVGCSLALVYAALGAFPVLPLPGHVSSVSYHADSLIDVAITAETAHHWPATVPYISGLHLNYHWLVYAHTGAMAQVTGLDPALIVFRLATPLMLLAAFLLAFVAGRRLSGSERVGALGALLLFLVGELHLTTSPSATFLGTFREALWKSSTFLFGLVFFLAALVLLWEQLDPAGSRNRRTWLVLGPLLFVAGGAKAPVPVVLFGGVLAYGAWRLVTQRRIDREVVRAALVIASAIALDWAVFFRGTSDALKFAPLASIRQSLFYLKLVPYISHSARPLLGVAGVAALLVPLAGVVVVLARRRLAPPQGYLLCLFLAGFVVFSVVDAPGGILPELWFLTYAQAAGVLLSAWGAAAVWRMGSKWPELRRRCLLAVGVVLVALGVSVVAIDKPFSREAKSVRVYFAFLAVAVVVVLLASWRGRTVGRPRGVAALTALALALGAGALDGPLSLSTSIRMVVRQQPGYMRDTNSSRGMTRELFNGLRWIRAHTPSNAVLAVNNHYVNAETHESRYLYYSAFAERRVFLESWWYSAAALALGTPAILAGAQPFPERWDLNQRVFERADRAAASELRQHYGVTFLLIDHTHGSASPLVSDLGHLVHSNSAISVYSLDQ